MPYTPPAARSPTTSKSASPALSPSHSHNKGHQHERTAKDHVSRPGLPRSVSSASYLHKHRRSPSSPKATTFTTGNPTPDTSPANDTSLEDVIDQSSTNEHTRNPSGQRSANNTRWADSPPESNQNSSDDDDNRRRGRVRDLKNLAELQAAIEAIKQRRMCSPNGISDETKKHILASGHNVLRLNVPGNDNTEQATLSPHSPLSEGARKVSHSRSNTEGSAFLDFPRNKFDFPTHSTSESETDEGDEGDLREKPAMVRKKSGELVRPALRGSSMRRRPSSMPGTPTYGKAVHFDSRLEHVRHFLQVDRPLAVSAGTSPVDSQEDDTEFPFHRQTNTPDVEWEIRLTNFPSDTLERKCAAVRVERVFLSANKKSLMGAIAVRNVAFHKFVVARFTLDYWKTTSEVVADFNNDVRRKYTDEGYDPFVFNIKLDDQNNLENKTLFFCVRYNVDGQEYWDNNNSINYQVDFSKNEKSHGQAALRSKAALSLPSGRPRSMPISADDFSHGFASPSEIYSFPQPPAQVIGDSPIRFRNSKATRDIVPDHPGTRTNAAGQAFGNRYDFGASLSAAMNAAGSVPTDRGGFQMREEVSSASTKRNTKAEGAGSADGEGSTRSGAEKPAKGPETKSDPCKPVALVAEKPAIQSSSYSELLDKYCFFGSTKATSPPSKSIQGHAESAGSAKAKVEPELVKAPELQNSSPPQTLPPREESRPASKVVTPRVSRASSPAMGSAMGSRTSSPISFGYPYNQSMQNAFFPEIHAPAAIRG